MRARATATRPRRAGQRRIDVLEFDRIARSWGADPLDLFPAATNPPSRAACGLQGALGVKTERP